MKMGGRLLLAGALALSLAACASAPLHYYTLVPMAEDGAVPSGPPAPFQFELLPVGIPAQVDQPQLVIRQDGPGVTVLNGERWIAPLADEVRAALSAGLARELGTQDVSGLPATAQPRLRIKLDLRRFDSVPGRVVLIDAAWSLRSLKDGAGLTCTGHFSEPVGPGYAALVQGHQQALARLAHGMAEAARQLAAGRTPACPP